jgi:ubiquinone/menaquinone biosynthesis C-methylase UbiE
VLKHLDDEALLTSLREVVRVLRPGGRFLLWEFEKSARSALLFWSARLTGLPPPFQLRTMAEFSRALRLVGFHRVVRVDAGFFLLPPVPRIAVLATR